MGLGGGRDGKRINIPFTHSWCLSCKNTETPETVASITSMTVQIISKIVIISNKLLIFFDGRVLSSDHCFRAILFTGKELVLNKYYGYSSHFSITKPSTFSIVLCLISLKFKILRIQTMYHISKLIVFLKTFTQLIF